MKKTADAAGPGGPPSGHALVIGGSMAGMMAARVLADHFARVTILERDRLPESAGPRKGAPQARHVHLLLIRGYTIAECLFPGLQADLAAAGALDCDWIADLLWYSGAGVKPRVPSDLRGTLCSRDLLEWAVRRRLAALPAIRILEERQVTGLVTDAGATAVTGVRVRRRGPAGDESNEEEIIHADLVVDAAGRSSRTPEWLEALGYPAPAETTINSFLGYASRIFRAPEDSDAWKVLYLQLAAPRWTRGGVIFPLEGRRWHVTLSGVGGDYPPTDEAGFMAFARSLPHSDLYEAIKDAEPLTSIHGYQQTANRMRHYERLARRPERLVVLGDAACAFNPVYGQGMTVGAMGAMVLDRCLRRTGTADLTGLAGRFQKALAKENATPWLLATAEDFRVPQTEGGHAGPVLRVMHRYLDGVTRLASERPSAHLTMARVLHLIAPPAALFHPRISVPVLGRALRRSRPASPAVASAPIVEQPG